MAASIKFPKPDRFYGDPRSYNPWITSVELYFTSVPIAGDNDRIRYALGLLSSAADDWKKDYINTHGPTNPNGLGTWQTFVAALEQSFRPIRHAEEAHRKIRAWKQNGGYIDEYIAGFSVLASEAGLTDGAPIRQYFKEGLDREVRIEAIRTNPQTLENWKTAARNAYTIIREIRESQGPSRRPTFRSPKGDRRNFKGKCNGRNLGNPRYTDITTLPYTRPHPRSEYDMDVDSIYNIINNLTSGGNNDDDLSESDSEHDSDGQEDDSEDEVNHIMGKGKGKNPSNPYKEALLHLVNNINNTLNDEQRTALGFGDCFFCHKPGHGYRKCEARKRYLANKQGRKTSGKPFRPSKGKGTPSSSSSQKRKGRKPKKVDPNAMIYNLMSQLEVNSDEEGLDSDPDGNF